MTTQSFIIALVIMATIVATRSRQNTRWPLWAAITMGVLPVAIAFLSRFMTDPQTAASYGLITSFVAWPVAWALLFGWLFRSSKFQGKRSLSVGKKR